MIVGILLALVTSVSWALGNIFVKRSSEAVGAPRAVLWALLAGGALCGGLAPLLDTRTAPLTGTVLAWTAVAGLAGLLAYVCLFHAFERAPLAIAVPLISSWSLFAGLLSLTVLGERLRPGQAVGAALVVAGVILVSLRGGEGGARPGARAGSWAAFGSAVGFGVMVPALGRASPALGELGATAVVYASGLLLGLPLALGLRVPLRPPPRQLWGLLLATGCFETLGFVAMAFARRYAPMAVVTPVASLSAALTVLYAAAVLRERPGRRAAVGAALACGGIVVLSL